MGANVVFYDRRIFSSCAFAGDAPKEKQRKRVLARDIFCPRNLRGWRIVLLGVHVCVLIFSSACAGLFR